jgi:tRNA dimethylallyltransferase
VAAPLIAIVGPTASGKSRLGLRLAKARGGEIVSCDSLQIYRGLDIGSAKPTAEERRQVAHHLLDVADPDEDFSAADYARRAREAVRDIAARGRLPIVVGGTGLYLRALLLGLFEGPSRDERLRARLTRIAERFGDARLHRLLARLDPVAAARIEPRDRVRVVRAIEVFRVTGTPLSQHHRTVPVPLVGFEARILGLDPPRETLREAVAERTRRMFERGLLQEAKRLLDRGLSPALRPLRAIGYRQAIAALRGDLSPQEAEDAIVTATLQYAKRQRTWFRHQTRASWFGSGQAAEAAFLSP